MRFNHLEKCVLHYIQLAVPENTIYSALHHFANFGNLCRKLPKLKINN